MYNNWNYISAESIVAQVKQELSSYFDSGSLTEDLVPTYVDEAMRKLRALVLDYREDIIPVQEFKATLPEDFGFLGEAYLITKVHSISTPVITSKFEYYKKTFCNDHCGNEFETFSQTTQTIPTWLSTHLNPSLLNVYYTSRNFCVDSCKGLFIDSLDSIKINKKTITSTFREGEIYLQYYTQPEDDFGPLVPEVIEVENYLKAYLYYKFFSILYNSVTDESINIIERKLNRYKLEYYNHYETALNTLKYESKQKYRDNLNKTLRRNIKFIIL